MQVTPTVTVTCTFPFCEWLSFLRFFENVPYLKKSTTTRPIITHNVKERKGLVFLACFFENVPLI